MPGGHRSNGTALLDWVLPLVGITSALALAFGIGWLEAREGYKRQYTPAAYAEAARTDAARRCFGREPAAVFECVDEKVKTSYQAAHDEQDLSAQQRAASAALISAVVGFLAFAISIVGVWYVKRTLDATLRAVEDTGEATKAMVRANEIAERVQRPWVSIQLIPKLIVSNESSYRVEIGVACKNLGMLTAENYRLRIALEWSPTGSHDEIESVLKSFDPGNKPGRKVILPSDTETFPFWSYQSKQTLPWVQSQGEEVIIPVFVVSAFYQSGVTGDRWLRTDKAVYLARKVEGRQSDALFRRSFVGSLRSNEIILEPVMVATLAD